MKSIWNLYKDAYRGLNTKIWLLAITQLINRSGTMVVFFLSVYLHDELMFDLSKVGIMMAMFGLGSFVGVYIAGRLIDKIGFYPIMLMSLILGAAMFVVVSFLTGFVSLCFGLFVLSALGESFRPANMAAVAKFSNPENYTRSLSLNRLAVNLGFALGPATGGVLAYYSYSYIFWADGITCLLASVIVFYFLKPENQEREAKTSEHRVPTLSPFRDKAFMLFLPLTFFYAAAFFQFFSTMPLYYKEVERFNEAQIGGLMALNGLLVASIEMVLIYKLEKKWNLYKFIALGSALLIMSYLSLLFLGGMAWLVVLTVIISFSEMLAMPFMTTYMNNRSGAKNKGQYASLYIMAWSAAQIATPFLVTQIISGFGYQAVWLTMAAFSIIVTIGILRLAKIS